MSHPHNRRPCLTLALFVLVLATTLAAGQSSDVKPLPGGKAPAPRNPTEQIIQELLARPAPPPIDPAEAERAANQFQPPAGFFDPSKPPRDDADLRELVAYWTKNGKGSLRLPTTVVRERLLEAAEEDPSILPELLKVLPDTKEAAERIAALYEAAQSSDRFEFPWHSWVGYWLRYHSAHFIDELATPASRVKDRRGEIVNEDELIAWAKYSREQARPLLERLAAGSQSRTSALALSMLYRNAVEDHEAGDEDKYRTQVQRIAEDRAAPAKAREVAIKGILDVEWSGRDDWFISLLADATLLGADDKGTTLNPLLDYGTHDPDKWVPIMANLVESSDRSTQRNAGNWLVNLVTSEPRRDAILPLLRWLSDPDWLGLENDQRAAFIQKLDQVEVPEAIPGLIWIVANDLTNRRTAASALTHYCDPRAIPALNSALAVSFADYDREPLLAALIASGGVTEADQARSVEEYAVRASTEEGRQEVDRYRYGESDALPLSVAIGKFLAKQQTVADPVAQAVVARAMELERKDPNLARSLFETIRGWQVSPVDIEVIRRLGSGPVDAGLIFNLLERRNRLRERLGPALGSLVGAGGVAAGVAVVVSGDEMQASNLLSSDDEAAKLSLLACARSVQMQLSVMQVRPQLRSTNAMLAFAAESYLLGDDRPDARSALWDRYPGQAFVTGWRGELNEYSSNSTDRSEEELRREVLGGPGSPLEIYAYIPSYGDEKRVVRVYADRVVYTYYENSFRYRQRVIEPEAFLKFRSEVERRRITEAGPRLGLCDHDCNTFEFMVLTRNGARRMFHQLSSLNSFDTRRTFWALDAGAKTRYLLEDVVPGSEIVISDESGKVRDISQQGRELLVRIEREKTDAEDDQEDAEEQEADDNGDEYSGPEREALEASQEARKRERSGWYRLGPGGATDPAPRPPFVATLDEPDLSIDYERFSEDDNDRMGTAIAEQSVIIVGGDQSRGMWKRSGNGVLTRITSENPYGDPVISSNGRWLMAVRKNDESYKPVLVRIDLTTGREFRLKVAPADDAEVLCYLPTLDRFLIERERDGSANPVGPVSPEHSLVDPANGQTTRVTGDFTPLDQIGPRMLQSTTKAGEYWVAMPDTEKGTTQVGRYDVKDFSFHPVMTVPHLNFDSMAMWVDEAGGKVYIVYQGQLIRLPLTVAPTSAPAP